MMERREPGDFIDFLLLGVMMAPAESNLKGLTIGLRIESCDCLLPILFV